MRLILTSIVSIFLAAANVLARANNTLTVYANDSFVSKWGPGIELKSIFERSCQCEVKWVAAADGAALLARLKIEGKTSKADVVIGIDDTAWSQSETSGFYIKHEVPYMDANIPKEIALSTYFMPIDFSYYAFMFDTQAKDKHGKPFKRPETFEDLITSDTYAKSVIIQDPRTSASGFGLLLWLRARYGAQYPAKLKQFKSQVLTIGKSWSQSYGLFTKGEAPIVFSYITSEAYHKAEEKTSRYQALSFPEGHYPTVEGAGILANSKNINLARQFLRFLRSEEAQAIISSKNWMLPAFKTTHKLPLELTQVKLPSTTLSVNSSEISKFQKQWIEEWLNTFQN